MHGLASQLNVLAASHTTLYTTLQEVVDAKKGERGPSRNSRSYRRSTPTRQAVLALPSTEASQSSRQKFEELEELAPFATE